MDVRQLAESAGVSLADPWFVDKLRVLCDSYGCLIGTIRKRGKNQMSVEFNSKSNELFIYLLSSRYGTVTQTI